MMICLGILWSILILYFYMTFQSYADDFGRIKSQFRSELLKLEDDGDHGLYVDLNGKLNWHEPPPEYFNSDSMKKRSDSAIKIVKAFQEEFSVLNNKIIKHSNGVMNIESYIFTFREITEACRVAQIDGWYVSLIPGLIQLSLLLIGGCVLFLVGLKF